MPVPGRSARGAIGLVRRASAATIARHPITCANHAWPGAPAESGPGVITQTISARTIIWRFFADHALYR
ncbi:MAG TPA: hypothetical protein VH373_02185 [Jatrophihabitantaceae bacterium]